MMALAGGQVTATGPHSGIPGSLETMTANVAAYDVAGRVAILCETSYSAMPRLAAGEASFGLIFVDGDHQAGAVRHDVGWALRLLAPGGVLACHDYGEECCCPGVRQAASGRRSCGCGCPGTSAATLTPGGRSESALFREP
jgi:hypothetical protein